MKKRILTVALVLALLATCFAGTYAFLTDSDAKTNTFTVGNVDIVLHESTLHRDTDNASDEEIIEDAASYEEYLETNGKNMVPGRWVKKAPYIENVGNNPCYVRIKMTVSNELFSALEVMVYTTATTTAAPEEGKGGMISNPVAVPNGDGTTTYIFTYEDALDPDQVTYYAPFWQFKIKDHLDNEDLVDFVGENILNEIVVTAEAIQSEGFDTVEEAFAAFDAQEVPAA